MERVRIEYFARNDVFEKCIARKPVSFTELANICGTAPKTLRRLLSGESVLPCTAKRITDCLRNYFGVYYVPFKAQIVYVWE